MGDNDLVGVYYSKLKEIEDITLRAGGRVRTRWWVSVHGFGFASHARVLHEPRHVP